LLSKCDFSPFMMRRVSDLGGKAASRDLYMNS
jgi:hypothetical protein